MREQLEIGSSPCEEDCAQVGSANYRTHAYREMRTFIAQLRRTFGPEPATAHLTIRAFPHDFGTYHEVVVTWDEDDYIGQEYAYRIEANTPATWDAIARVELGLPPA